MDNPLKDVSPKQKKVLTFVGIGAAGYVVWRWFQSSRTPVDTTPVTASTDASQTATGVIGSNVGANENVGNSGNTDSSNLISTNDKWFSEAVDRLVASGWNGQTVQSALGDFLTGQPLTTSEASIVRAAVGAMGGYPPAGPTTLKEVPGVTDVSKLSAPTGLKVSNVTSSTVDLTWSPVAGAKQYRVYRSGASQNVAASVDTKAQVAGLQPGKSYTLYVAAGLDGEKMGPRSTGVSFKSGALKLTAPTGVRVSSISKSAAHLNWSTVGGSSGYLIRRSGSSSTWESADTGTNVTGLKPNTKYSYQVAAVAPGTRTPGPWSGYVTFTTKR